MTASLATGPAPYDRSAFFFHLPVPADQDGLSDQFSTENTGEDATVRLQQLAKLVDTECASAEALRNALEGTSMAFAQRITWSVRQRRTPDDRDFASLRLLDCARDAQERGQKAYIGRQVWLALALYISR